MTTTKNNPATTKPGITGLAIAAILLAASIIKPWEGKENKPYRDVVGVLTVCYGHTGKDIEMRNYTDSECDALLHADMKTANAAVNRCITRPIAIHIEAALTSAAFNIGDKVVCGSGLQRKANAGDIAGACAELDRWVYAKGRKIKGLVNRRAAERRMCEGKAA